MADPPHEAGEPPHVEMFGVLELKLSSSNATGYKDVYKRKHLKKKPYQGLIWRPWRKDHINVGNFATAHAAAVAVAVQRAEGIDDLPSPDRTRAENSTLPHPTFERQCLLSLILLLLIRISCGKRSESLRRRRLPRHQPRSKASRISSCSYQSRRCSRGLRPRALGPLPQAQLALRSPRSRLHFSRRQFRALWVSFPMVGGL